MYYFIVYYQLVIDTHLSSIKAGADVILTNTFTLDRPLAFYHPDNDDVDEVSAIGGDATRADKNKYITKCMFPHPAVQCRACTQKMHRNPPTDTFPPIVGSIYPIQIYICYKMYIP